MKFVVKLVLDIELQVNETMYVIIVKMEEIHLRKVKDRKRLELILKLRLDLIRVMCLLIKLWISLRIPLRFLR